MNAQPQAQPQPRSRKRKASTDQPDHDADADAKIESHLLDENGVHAADVLDSVCADTTAELKKLLRMYSQAATSGAAPDNNDYAHVDATKELEAILTDIASRPEMLAMQEVKSMLLDCGIEVDIYHDRNGGQSVSVQLR